MREQMNKRNNEESTNLALPLSSQPGVKYLGIAEPLACVGGGVEL